MARRSESKPTKFFDVGDRPSFLGAAFAAISTLLTVWKHREAAHCTKSRNHSVMMQIITLRPTPGGSGRSVLAPSSASISIATRKCLKKQLFADDQELQTESPELSSSREGAAFPLSCPERNPPRVQCGLYVREIRVRVSGSEPPSRGHGPLTEAY